MHRRILAFLKIIFSTGDIESTFIDAKRVMVATIGLISFENIDSIVTLSGDLEYVKSLVHWS